MESVAIALATTAVIATALFKAAATWAEAPTHSRENEFDFALVASLYPEQSGAAIDDGLPGGASVVAWGDIADKGLHEATEIAAVTVGAFLKISDDLQIIVPEAAATLRDHSRAIGIASIVAAAAPIMYPGQTAEKVYIEWYQQMAAVYYEPTVAATAEPPARIMLTLDAPLQRVVYAALGRA